MKSFRLFSPAGADVGGGNVRRLRFAPPAVIDVAPRWGFSDNFATPSDATLYSLDSREQCHLYSRYRFDFVLMQCVKVPEALNVNNRRWSEHRERNRRIAYPHQAHSPSGAEQRDVLCCLAVCHISIFMYVLFKRIA